MYKRKALRHESQVRARRRTNDRAGCGGSRTGAKPNAFCQPARRPHMFCKDYVRIKTMPITIDSVCKERRSMAHSACAGTLQGNRGAAASTRTGVFGLAEAGATSKEGERLQQGAPPPPRAPGVPARDNAESSSSARAIRARVGNGAARVFGPECAPFRPDHANAGSKPPAPRGVSGLGGTAARIRAVWVKRPPL